MPVKVTERNAHLWTPTELIEREHELRQQELASKYRSIPRTHEIRFVRVLLMDKTRLI